MGLIVIHEIRQLVKSYKFYVFFVVTIITTLLTSYIQINEYKKELEIYNEELGKYKSWEEKVCLFSQLEIPHLISPNPLAIFSKGVDDIAGNKLIFSTDKAMEFKRDNIADNPFLNIFRKLDITTLIINVLSVLILLLIAESISLEKEEKTWHMVFSNPVLKVNYVFSKFLASLIIVVLPILIAFLLPVFIFLIDPHIALTAKVLSKLVMLFLSTILYVSILILIGLFISSRTSSSAVSTIIALFVWLIITIIYPNTAAYVVNMTSSPFSDKEIAREKKVLYQSYRNKMREWEENTRPKEQVYRHFMSKNEFFPSVIGFSTKTCFDFHEKKIKEMLPAYLEVTRKMMEIDDKNRRVLYQKRRLINNLTYILPGTLYQSGNEKIANTDFEHREGKLLEKARYFRNTVLYDYLESKGAIGLKYFTQLPREEMADSIHHYSSGILEKYNPNNYVPINLNDIPQFEYKGKFVVPMELFVLLFINVILFMATAYVFVNAKQ